jgi:soluble epoxide hydrolase/lipid-phosphate phosphatase
LFLADIFLAFGLSADLRPDLPFLFLWGTRDPTVIPSVIAKSGKFIPSYQGAALEGKGHWLMVEAKDEVTDTIINWLDGFSSSKHATKL